MGDRSYGFMSAARLVGLPKWVCVLRLIFICRRKFSDIGFTQKLRQEYCHFPSRYSQVCWWLPVLGQQLVAVRSFPYPEPRWICMKMLTFSHRLSPVRKPQEKCHSGFTQYSPSTLLAPFICSASTDYPWRASHCPCCVCIIGHITRFPFLFCLWSYLFWIFSDIEEKKGNI